MTRPMFASFFIPLSLFAVDGYQVYRTHCAKCHVEEMTKADAIKKFKTLKAPPMIEVSNKLRNNIIIADDDEEVHRAVVVAFIKDYVDNPALEKSMCDPMALERFDVMPSQKGKVNEEEKEAVAGWIYDHYLEKPFQ